MVVQPTSFATRFLTSIRVRWSHLYPNGQLETDTSLNKWKALCEPAVLPLTTPGSIAERRNQVNSLSPHAREHAPPPTSKHATYGGAKRRFQPCVVFCVCRGDVAAFLLLLLLLFVFSSTAADQSPMTSSYVRWCACLFLPRGTRGASTTCGFQTLCSLQKV